MKQNSQFNVHNRTLYLIYLWILILLKSHTYFISVSSVNNSDNVYKCEQGISAVFQAVTQTQMPLWPCNYGQHASPEVQFLGFHLVASSFFTHTSRHWKLSSWPNSTFHSVFTRTLWRGHRSLVRDTRSTSPSGTPPPSLVDFSALQMTTNLKLFMHFTIHLNLR